MPKIMLVDDEERFVRNVKKLLTYRGYSAFTALTGYQALDMIKQHGDFDVVVLDIKMPGIDGLETLRAIKQISTDIQVIMLTGHATIEAGVDAIQNGAFDFLIKPCDIDALIDKIKDAESLRQIKNKPVLWSRIHIKDIPFDPCLIVGRDDIIDKACLWFIRKPGQKAADTVFVLDDNQCLVGCFSQIEILLHARVVTGISNLTWHDLLQEQIRLPQIQSHTIMEPVHITADLDDSIIDVVRKMIHQKVRRVPVMENTKIMGSIALGELLNHIDPKAYPTRKRV